MIESTACLATVFEALPARILALDANGRILVVNAAWRRHQRSDARPMAAGDDFFQVWPQSGAIPDAFWHMSASGVREVLFGEREDWEMFWPDEFVEGPLRMTVSRLASDRNIVLVCVLDSPFEMQPSMRSCSEAYRRRYETPFRALVEGADDLFTSVDAQGNFTYLSPASERVFGIRPEDGLGRSAFDFIHPEDREATREAFAGWVRNRLDKATHENRYIRKNGKTVDLMWTISFIYDSAGNFAGANSIARDITFLRDVERELRQAKEISDSAAIAKSEFLGSVSHELRTPLNGILGMSEIILTTPLNPEQIEFIHDIKSSAEHLMGLINDLLDFSKMESGKMEITPEPFEIRPLIRSVVREMTVLSSRKGLDLSFDVAEDVPAVLIGDANRLRQILVNLVGNAVKFTHQGRVEVTVQCAGACIDASSISDDVYMEELIFSVSDSGIGIDPSHQDRIFDAFTQADSSLTRAYGGTGLGLTICRSLVRIMGGQIGVESEPGQGSVFTFIVPLPVPRQAALARRESAFIGGNQPQGLNVLVVDDHHVNRFICRRLLEKLGNRVTEADGGQSALDALNLRDFDIVFMDIMMPDLDGRSAARDAKDNLAAKGRSIPPFVAMSSDFNRDREQGWDDDTFVTRVGKPVSLAELEAVIYEVTGRSTPA